jgi:hypothetical protein
VHRDNAWQVATVEPVVLVILVLPHTSVMVARVLNASLQLIAPTLPRQSVTLMTILVKDALRVPNVKPEILLLKDVWEENVWSAMKMTTVSLRHPSVVPHMNALLSVLAMPNVWRRIQLFLFVMKTQVLAMNASTLWVAQTLSHFVILHHMNVSSA